MFETSKQIFWTLTAKGTARTIRNSGDQLRYQCIIDLVDLISHNQSGGQPLKHTEIGVLLPDHEFEVLQDCRVVFCVVPSAQPAGQRQKCFVMFKDGGPRPGDQFSVVLIAFVDPGGGVMV